MLLINSTDDYLGYCITSHLYASLHKEIRVLYHRHQPWISNFQSKGIQTYQIKDTSSPHVLSQAMRHVDQIILTLGSHPDRVQHCQAICKVAARSGVKSIIFVSHIGAQSEMHTLLYDYGLVETYLVQAEEEHSMAYTILRLDWIQQYFHLWACQADHTRMLSLPMHDATVICPVDISDVCRVLEAFVVNQDGTFCQEIDNQHVGQVYTLTGPEAITSKEIMHNMAKATRYHQFKYHMVRPMDTSFYLKSLSHNVWFDERIKNEHVFSYRDSLASDASYRTKALSVPNDTQIDTFIDYFDWVVKTSGSVPVEHIKLFNKQPKTLQDFFLENANSFKPRV